MDLLRRHVNGETLDKQFTIYSSSVDAADKGCRMLLSTDAFMTSSAAFIQRRAGEAITAEHVTTKMEDHMKALITDSAAKHTTLKSVSPPSHTDSAYSPSWSGKEEDCKPDLRRSKNHKSSRRSHGR